MIDRVLFRKLPGNGKAQPRFPSRAIRSIEVETGRSLMEKAGQTLSS